MKLSEKLALLALIGIAVLGLIVYFKLEPAYSALTWLIAYLGTVNITSITEAVVKNWQIVTGSIGALFAVGLPIIKLYREQQAKKQVIADNVAMAKEYAKSQLDSATNVDVLKTQLLEQQKTINTQQKQLQETMNPNLTALQQENNYLKQELLVAQRTASDALTQLQNTPVKIITQHK
jgi:hypothetical protein